MKRQSCGTTLFLWKNIPSVFVGRNQNFYKECDLDYLNTQGILPVRRFSGGGAVFQDEGNLNFSFVTPVAEADVEKMKRVIEVAMKAVGVNGSFSGRNDFLVNEKKISGQAYYEEDGCFLYHGTLLCDVDLERMQQALQPSLLKLESKGISSVRSRVINLCELVTTLTVKKMEKTMEQAFETVYGEGGMVEKVTCINAKTHPANEELLRQLKSEEWIYGQSPNWSVYLERKQRDALVSAQVSVVDGKIADIRIYTDCVQAVDFSSCERELKGRGFSETEIFDVVEKLCYH